MLNKINNFELKRNYHAMIIAMQKYIDPSLDLRKPVEDAQKFFDILTQHYTFNKDNIIFLKNPYRHTILLELYKLSKVITENDNLLVFYAGHGWWDESRKQSYWLVRNSSIEEPSEWLSNSEIRDYIQGIKSHHTLLITDACFSGTFFARGNIITDSKANNKRGRIAITSGSKEYVPDKSVFLEKLIEALENNEKIKYTAFELYSDIVEPVHQNSPVKQKPLYGPIQGTGDEGGDFIFTRKLHDKSL